MCHFWGHPVYPSIYEASVMSVRLYAVVIQTMTVTMLTPEVKTVEAFHMKWESRSIKSHIWQQLVHNKIIAAWSSIHIVTRISSAIPRRRKSFFGATLPGCTKRRASLQRISICHVHLALGRPPSVSGDVLLAVPLQVDRSDPKG